MKKIAACLFASVLFVGGFFSCASPYGSTFKVLPQHMSKVYVESFKNNTTRGGLESELKNEVMDEITMDGRLSLVNNKEEADGVLNVTINEYILQPLTYDINNYKMSVAIDVSLVDGDNGLSLWNDSNLEGTQIYDSTSIKDFEDPGTVEEKAREMLWTKISKNVVRKIVKGFGSVKSISEKKVAENSN